MLAVFKQVTRPLIKNKGRVWFRGCQIFNILVVVAAFSGGGGGREKEIG